MQRKSNSRFCKVYTELFFCNFTQSFIKSCSFRVPNFFVIVIFTVGYVPNANKTTKTCTAIQRIFPVILKIRVKTKLSDFPAPCYISTIRLRYVDGCFFLFNIIKFSTNSRRRQINELATCCFKLALQLLYFGIELEVVVTCKRG